MKPSAPLIRWAGSKRLYVRRLSQFIDRNPTRYLEPFCGSAAVYFSISPSNAILSDVNSSLIEFYRATRDDPVQVYRTAAGIPRDRKTYYSIRAQFNTENDDLRKAAYFYYLNKNCFNGLYRTCKEGRFNVPFSESRTGLYPTEEAFAAASRCLKRAKILCGDFEAVVRKYCKRHDVVYLDPPYSSTYRYPFREYFPGSFCVDDFSRLNETLSYIDDIGATFVLTYSRTLPLISLKPHWHSYQFRSRRNISGISSVRRNVNDVILTNCPL